MIDRRDFDEWWERERRRSGGHEIGADYRHWAEAGFMAATALLAQAIRTQKLVAKGAQKPAALLMRDMLKAADK